MTIVRKQGFRIAAVLLAGLILCLALQRPSLAADEPAQTEPAQEQEVMTEEPQETAAPEGVLASLESLPTTASIVLGATVIRDLPWQEGQEIGTLQAGESVNVFSQDLNEEWTAIVIEGVGLGYVQENDIALTAPAYEYSYLSNVTRITGLTAEQLEKAVAGTGLAGLGECYAEMEAKYGINALFLIGIAKLESASGTSGLARGQNNLGGIKDGKGGYLSFSSKAACVDHMARLLKDSYLTPGARYYHGQTSRDVNICYCESADWYSQVETLMSSSYGRIAA